EDAHPLAGALDKPVDELAGRGLGPDLPVVALAVVLVRPQRPVGRRADDATHAVDGERQGERVAADGLGDPPTSPGSHRPASCPAALMYATGSRRRLTPCMMSGR